MHIGFKMHFVKFESLVLNRIINLIQELKTITFYKTIITIILYLVFLFLHLQFILILLNLTTHFAAILFILSTAKMLTFE